MTSAREILRLSGLTLLTLVTEPLFLLADSAIVGHLGTPQLAGLALASAVIGTVVSFCIFLAYGSTASVARLLGAGDQRTAWAQGVDMLWLAAVVGGLVAVLALPLSGPVVGLFGAPAAVSHQAVAYLRVSLLGAPAMLLVLAAVGALRGARALRLPLVVAVTGNLANIALNWVLVYPLGLGITGSALGSVVAQAGMAAVVAGAVVRAARRHRAPLRPSATGLGRAFRGGVPLIVRTLLLRAALLVMTYSAAAFGATDLAAMQLALSIWTFLAFVLDALGITAQTLVGGALGSGSYAEARRLTERLVRWGVGYGVATGLVLGVVATLLGPLFTDDPRVRALLTPTLLVAALAQPVAGAVFALDGILIGAGDGRFLARAQAIVLAVFAPLAWLAVTGPGTLTWLWAAFAVGFMGTRGVVLLARARGDAWMRLGAG